MGFTRREFLAFASMAGAAGAAGMAGCSKPQQQEPAPDGEEPSGAEVDLNEFKDLELNMGSWRYDEENDAYYQLGLAYCKTPATKTYESLAIFVPGRFFNAEQNGNTYTCTINEKAVVGNFTPATAPILMPINTGSLSAQASPTVYEYSGLGAYLEKGCIYVYAGFRGRSAGVDTASGSTDMYPGGAPWPVVDLKAAVRYLRYNAASLPCDTNRVFVFGFSAGGGVSTVLGSSGDSALYDPYLKEIGAATHDAQGTALSDAIQGSASWCPVTSFDTADASYEWAMGQHATDASRAEGSWLRQFSADLAGSYGAWVNGMDLRGADDAQLTLDESEGAQFAMGSYADAIVDKLNDAATYFVQNTPFPYTYTPQKLEDPSFPGDPNLAATRAAAQASGLGSAVSAPKDAEVADAGAAASDDASAADGAAADDAAADADTGSDGSDGATSPDADDSAPVATTLPQGTMQVQSTIYDTPTNYFAALNSDYWWINYNLKRETVTVQSLRDFVLHLRPAELACAPYDQPDRSSRTNQLFGIGEESTLHFDAMAGDLIQKNVDAYAACADWDPDYETAWEDDLDKEDALETSMATRVDMMNPLYWLSGAYEGYGQATVAPHWRINEGVFDTTVSPCTSLNLALALSKFDGVSDVAYTPVWGQGHMLAERGGSATNNLMNWIISCCTE